MSTDFIITHGTLFTCPRCQGQIQIMHHGLGHVGSGNHCQNCGASYTIQWFPPIEKVELFLAEKERREGTALKGEI